MKITTLLICILYNINLSFSQDTLIVKLKTKRKSIDISRVSTPLLFYNDFHKYKGVNYHKDSTWIGRLVLNREQYWFDQSKLNDSLNTYYIEKLKQTGLDLNELSPIPLKTYISVFVQLQNNKKIIIVDTDNNFDFTNNDINQYEFGLNTNFSFIENYENISVSKVKFESFNNGLVVWKYEEIKVKPFDSAYNYKNKKDALSAVYFSPVNFQHSYFDFQNKSYELSINKIDKIGFLDNPVNFSYNINFFNEKIKNQDWIKFQKKIKINNNIFQILDYNLIDSTAKIFIRPTFKSDYGWNVGDYIPEIIKSKTISIKPNNVNLNILNFWGSWCGPCLKEIPSIIELYHKNSDQINLINVGCENTNDGIEKAKKITFEKKMEWLQFYEITGGIDTFSNLLNVYTFPTLIVFDNTGLIIARETDLGNVEIIKEKLKLN